MRRAAAAMDDDFELPVLGDVLAPAASPVAAPEP